MQRPLSLIAIEQRMANGEKPAGIGPDGFPAFADDPAFEVHQKLNAALPELEEGFGVKSRPFLKAAAAEQILSIKALCVRSFRIHFETLGQDDPRIHHYFELCGLLAAFPS